MNFDEKIMLKCIELAKKGSNNVYPNPMVGCIIIHENKIIGSGYHINMVIIMLNLMQLIT